MGTVGRLPSAPKRRATPGRDGDFQTRRHSQWGEPPASVQTKGDQPFRRATGPRGSIDRWPTYLLAASRDRLKPGRQGPIRFHRGPTEGVKGVIRVSGARDTLMCRRLQEIGRKVSTGSGRCQRCHWVSQGVKTTHCFRGPHGLLSLRYGPPFTWEHG